MAAISARASYIVTTDEDLLCLEKPYGIACATPREFLAVILRQH
jgi:predicted nucleic acid-binding protein